MNETFLNIGYNRFGDNMYVIDKNCKNELLIKNSRFITLIFKVETKEEIQKLLEKIKEHYPKATHYCYAYITSSYKKTSDDGEPSGTAGTPILNILEKEQITNVLAVVIRYFGGIKLGAGGLIRAYSKSISKALISTNKIELVKGLQVDIEFDYKKQKEIEHLLKNSTILEKTFLDKIIYKTLITNQIYQKLKNSSDYRIIRKSTTWIQKMSG